MEMKRGVHMRGAERNGPEGNCHREAVEGSGLLAQQVRRPLFRLGLLTPLVPAMPLRKVTDGSRVVQKGQAAADQPGSVIGCSLHRL